MGSRWTKADLANFRRVRDQRLPAALERSRALQNAFGIEPGMKMVGPSLVRLWQLPDPPYDSVEQMFEKLRKKLSLTDVKDPKAQSRTACTYKKHGDSSPARKGTDTRRPTHDATCDRKTGIPSTVADSGENLVRSQADELGASQQVLRNLFGDLPHLAASPPPVLQPHPHDPTPVPAYWSNTLSSHLNRWMSRPETTCSQVRLSHIELRGIIYTGVPMTLTSIDSTSDMARIKLIHMKIDPSTGNGPAATSQPRGWLVLQIDFLDAPVTDGGEEEHIDPLPKGERPYWILAFPLQAVMYSKTVFLDTMTQPSSSSPGYVTTFVLGVEGRAPLAHGRGVSTKFARSFIEACSQGSGMIEAQSIGATPFV